MFAEIQPACGSKWKTLTSTITFTSRSSKEVIRETTRRNRDRCLMWLSFIVSQRWAQDHDIRLKLFNPCQAVRDKLEHANSKRQFDIATLEEMMAILVWADSRYARAA